MLADPSAYKRLALEQADTSNVVTLTGRTPVRIASLAQTSYILYLRVAHALRGKIKTLLYDSPVTGEVIIFDHNPY